MILFGLYKQLDLLYRFTKFVFALYGNVILVRVKILYLIILRSSQSLVNFLGVDRFNDPNHNQNWGKQPRFESEGVTASLHFVSFVLFKKGREGGISKK